MPKKDSIANIAEEYQKFWEVAEQLADKEARQFTDGNRIQRFHGRTMTKMPKNTFRQHRLEVNVMAMVEMYLGRYGHPEPVED